MLIINPEKTSGHGTDGHTSDVKERKGGRRVRDTGEQDRNSMRGKEKQGRENVVRNGRPRTTRQRCANNCLQNDPHPRRQVGQVAFFQVLFRRQGQGCREGRVWASETGR